MMTKQKRPSLYKDPDYNIMEKELRISTKSLLFIAFICILFIVFAFLAVPQTYGFLENGGLKVC